MYLLLQLTEHGQDLLHRRRGVRVGRRSRLDRMSVDRWRRKKWRASRRRQCARSRDMWKATLLLPAVMLNVPEDTTMVASDRLLRPR